MAMPADDAQRLRLKVTTSEVAATFNIACDRAQNTAKEARNQEFITEVVTYSVMQQAAALQCCTKMFFYV